jgi:hypothetical protein
MKLPTRAEATQWLNHFLFHDIPETTVAMLKGMDVFLRLIFSHPRVVTCPQGVVSYVAYDLYFTKPSGIPPSADPYSPSHLLRDWKNIHPLDAIDQKIVDILAANPDADLKALEGALGIKILNVQRTKPSYSSPDHIDL